MFSVIIRNFSMKQLSAALLLSLMLAWPFAVFPADTTRVQGKVVNGKGYIIRLMTYNDQVSYTRMTLDEYSIGEDESFSLSTVTDKVLYCWLDLEFQQAGIFLQPGQSYEVETELRDKSLTGSYYNRSALPLKFVRDDNDHLNLSIQDFNQLYNDFLLSYAETNQQRNAKPAFDNFINAIEIRFQNNDNPFFREYLRYKTAAMQLYLRLKSRDNIGKEYLSSSPVLYDNPEYMDFFHLFFEKYFITGGKYFTFNKTYDLVNGDAGYNEITDSLMADPVLGGQELRELLLLSGLKELYNVNGFKRTRVFSLIREMSVNSGFETIRTLAGNLMISLRRLQYGSEAPGFSLPDISTNRVYSLSDFKGKKLYLAFFGSDNPASQSELGLIADFYEDYKDKVHFVAISVDKDISALQDYLGRAQLPWLVLHYGGDLALLENYDANTFPHFVLINQQGQIIRCPAPSPSENVQKLFDSN